MQNKDRRQACLLLWKRGEAHFASAYSRVLLLLYIELYPCIHIDDCVLSQAKVICCVLCKLYHSLSRLLGIYI